MNDHDWLSMLLYRECSYKNLSFENRKVITKTYRDRKLAIKLTRALFKLSMAIRNIGNTLLKHRIKNKLNTEYTYRYIRGWWS